METRKVAIRVKKVLPVIEKAKSEKQKRYEERIAERKLNKKPTKNELLLADGKRFVNFVIDIELMNEWIKLCDSYDLKPNYRFIELIKNDIGENK